VIKITTVKDKEKQEIRDSLINAYEVLEEKLNENNNKIGNLNSELQNKSDVSQE